MATRLCVGVVSSTAAPLHSAGVSMANMPYGIGSPHATMTCIMAAVVSGRRARTSLRLPPSLLQGLHRHEEMTTWTSHAGPSEREDPGVNQNQRRTSEPQACLGLALVACALVHQSASPVDQQGLQVARGAGEPTPQWVHPETEGLNSQNSLVGIGSLAPRNSFPSCHAPQG